MKRISCYLFIVVLLFLVIGCEGLGTTQKCDHIWGEWNIVTEATCAKNGLKQQTCTLCSKTNEEVIPITDEHKYVEEKIEQELTCVVDEVVVYTCSVCGNSKKEITKIASGHNYVGDVCDACGHEKSIIPEYSTNQLENLKTTITFWHSLDTKEVEILNKIVQQFNEKYPNIKVELVYKGKPENLRDWILKSIRTNSTPTITQTFAGNAIFYNTQNVLSDLREYRNHELYGLTSTQLNDYVDKTYITTEYEVPFTRNMEVMYFNATWFEEHGLLEKYNLGKIINGKFIKNENACLTWDEIAEIGEYYLTTDEYTSLSDNEKLDNFLFSADSSSNLFIQLIKQWGSEYLTFDHLVDNNVDFDNDIAKEAIEWYLNGFEAGYLATASAWNMSYSSSKFTSENVKIMVGSSRGYSYNEASDNFVLGILPYPQKESSESADAKECAILESSGLSLFKQTDKDEELAGWLFMKYLSVWHDELSYEEQPTVLWVENTGCLPTLESVEKHDKFKKYLEDDKTVSKVISTSYEQIKYTYQVPNHNKTLLCNEYAGEIIDMVLYLTSSVDYAFERAISNIK